MVSELRLEVSKLEQRCHEETAKAEQVKLESQREVAEIEKRLVSTESQRMNADIRVDEALNRLSKTEGKMAAVSNGAFGLRP